MKITDFEIWGVPKSWGYPKLAKDDLLENTMEKDDDWGYPYFRKHPCGVITRFLKL